MNNATYRDYISHTKMLTRRTIVLREATARLWRKYCQARRKLGLEIFPMPECFFRHWKLTADTWQCVKNQRENLEEFMNSYKNLKAACLRELNSVKGGTA